MGLLVFTYAMAIFFIIISLLLNKGLSDDKINRRMQFINGKVKKEESVEELNDTFFNRFVAPGITKMKESFNRVNSRETSDKDNKKIKTVERQLRQAGMEDITADAFMFYKQGFMIIVIILTVFLFLFVQADSMVKLFILAAGLVVAIVLPDFYLKFRVSSRQEAIRIQVPDALDLLGVCIEAGLSFDSSLLKIAEKLEGPFIDELMIVYREIQMGVPRNDALKRLSEATDISELKTFVSALIQANQLGIPINNVMAVQSKQLRETRQQQAKEKGAKAPVKILFPMLFFIFPVLFIILMGPTVMNIMDTLM